MEIESEFNENLWEMSLRAHCQSPVDIKDKYDAWIQSNNNAKRYMIVGMNDVLRTKHEPMETAFEIMESLHAMFG